MRTNAEGDVILNETEKQIILEGMRLLSIYCENLTGCNNCPFRREAFADDAGNVVRYCECKNSLPCCWNIPEKWTKEADKNA